MTVPVPTGSRFLDELLGGGIPQGLAVILQGPAGEEKEAIAWRFMKEGLEGGKGAVVVLSSMSPRKFRERMAGLGVDVSEHEEAGRLVIVDWYSHFEETISDIQDEGSVLRVSVDLTNVGVALTWALDRIGETEGIRAVIDILSPALNTYDLKEVISFAQLTKAKLERRDATSLFLIQKDMYDAATLSSIQQPFDGVIDIERVREGDRIVRKIGVPSMRELPPVSKYVTFGLEETEPPGPASETEALQHAVRKSPKDAEAWMALARATLAAGDNEKALRYLEAVTTLEPDRVEAWEAKAEVFEALGRMEDAKEARARAEGGGERPETPAPPKAEATACPKCGTMLDAEAVLCYGCGANLPGEKHRRTKSIIEVADARLKRDPQDLDAVFVKGAALAKMERWQEAADFLNEVTKHEPAYPGIWILKAKVYARLGRPNMAKTCRKRAMEMMGQETITDTGPQVRAPRRPAAPAGAREVQPPEAVRKGGLVNGLIRERLARDRGRVNGLTNGRRGRTNGLVNGRGRTNGLVNGRGRTNGLVNGRGRTNGLVNGRGRTNGLVNGRGRTNGLVNGRGRTNGLVNGRGRTNGLVNGVAMGKVNGVTNGVMIGLRSARGRLADGLTNGSGFTNGLGASRFTREEIIGKWKVLLIPLIAVSLTVVPAINPGFELVPPGTLIIDGHFGEWSTLGTYPSAAGTTPSANVDIISAGATRSPGGLGLYVRVSGDAFQGDPGTRRSDTFFAFMDTDLSAQTGYAIRGIGADRLLTAHGYGGNPVSARLSAYDDSRGPYDWNAWSPIGSVALRAGGDAFEAVVGWFDLGGSPGEVDVVFAALSHLGDYEETDTLIPSEGGLLKATQRSAILAQNISGANQPLLSIELEAVRETTTIESIEVEVMGTASLSELSSLKLVDGSGGALAQVIPLQRSITFETEVVIPEGESRSLIVLADVVGTSGATLGARVSGPQAIAATGTTVSLASVDSPIEVAYIGAPSTAPKVDGGFFEWEGLALTDDVGEASVGGRDALDIVEYASSKDAGTALFYLRTQEGLMKGTVTPAIVPVTRDTAPQLKDSDGDTVPDSVDVYDFDFNNDGTPDASQPNDVDGDQITDYPDGPDMVLETTIPATWDFPYGGRNVSRYIGPVERPPRTGTDVVRVFVDANRTPWSGYLVDGMGADALIELEGKNGRLVASRLLSFNGSTQGQWSWEPAGAPVVAVSGSGMEFSVGVAALGLAAGESFDVVFQITDWNASASDTSGQPFQELSLDPFVLEKSGEVHQSTDDGASWSNKGDVGGGSAFVAITAASDTKLYVLDSAGIVYESSNDGVTWTQKGQSSTGTYVDISIDSNDYLFVLQDNGSVYRSTNRGTSWSFRGDADGTAGFQGLTVNSSDDLYALVGTNGSVYQSTDAGQTWTYRGDVGTSSNYIDITRDDTDYLYVLQDTGEVHRSTDAGSSWTQRGDAGTETYVAIDWDLGTGLYVLAATGEVYKSTDDASTWTYKGDVGGQPDYEDITAVIPEFEMLFVPLAGILIVSILCRRNRRRKT
jgi:KaiC/GvpD/RAD55 family RecA-like ATPase/photosystem II stability/assembly factor-like uncharacterized protein